MIKNYELYIQMYYLRYNNYFILSMEYDEYIVGIAQ